MISESIKKPGTIEKISEAELKKRALEMKKCIDDPIYFCSNYYYIRSIDKGTILLPLYKKQKELIEAIIYNRFTISLAARQSGKTTAYVGVALWICFFLSGKEIVLVANKEKTAIGILKRIKNAYEWIPKEKAWIKPGIKKWSEKQIEFENGCSITAMASSSDAARSASCLSGNTTICIRSKTVLYNNIRIAYAKNIVDNSQGKQFEILTDEGWCKFDKIVNNGERNDLVEINDSLVCTSDHKIFTTEGKLEAKNCDGKFTYTYNGTNKMSVVQLGKRTETVYDVLNVKNSKHSFFVNDGKFLVSNCYLLLIDEAHFIPKNIAGELFASVWPTLSRSETSKCVMVSTANGVGGLFYDIWQDATIGNNKTWHPVLINWWDIEGRDEKWKQEQIRGFGPGGELKFAQEFGNEFLGSSPTLLDNSALKDLTNLMLESKIEPEIWKIGNPKLGEFEVSIYKEPQKTHSYVLGGDVSEGIGMDYSIAKIFDITDPFNVEEVASFESNLVSGTLFGYIMTKMGRKYNDAYVACERNGVSATAIDALWRTFEYENVVDIGSNKYAVGIFSNHSVKLDACLHFRNLINDQDFNLILQDGKTILELQRFEKLKAKSIITYEASTGHDDRVMALIWAIYVLKQEYLENYYNVSSYKINAFGIEVPARLSFDLSMRTDGYFTSEEEFEIQRKELEKIADKKLKLLESGKSEKETSETEETSLDYDFAFNSNDIEDDDHSF